MLSALCSWLCASSRHHLCPEFAGQVGADAAGDEFAAAHGAGHGVPAAQDFGPLARKPLTFGVMPGGSVRLVVSLAMSFPNGLSDAAAVQAAVDATSRDDTLILVVADHNHPISLIGTIDDDMTAAPKAPLRERIGAYDKAGFPNYPPPDRDGYPPRVDVGKRLAIFSASSPDYYETFRPKLDDPNDPTVAGATKGTVEPNTRYRDQPGAMLRLGNLPKYMGASVHSGEDVILTATGPGSERVRGQIDNTEVFRIMAEALGLGHGE